MILRDKGRSKRRHNNPKCVWTKLQNCKISEAKIHKTERRNRQSWETATPFPQQLLEAIRQEIRKDKEELNKEH